MAIQLPLFTVHRDSIDALLWGITEMQKTVETSGGKEGGNTKNTGLLFPSRIVSYTAENHPATKQDSETVVAKV